MFSFIFIGLKFFLKANEDLRELLAQEKEKNQDLQEEIKEIRFRKDDEIKQLRDQFYAFMSEKDQLIKRLQTQSKCSLQMVFILILKRLSKV